MSFALSRDRIFNVSATGVFGFLVSAAKILYFFIQLRLAPMIRSTSSETLAILAIPSTSASVNFGLLITAAAIILFGSRIRMARISREPFEAAFSRSGKVILESLCMRLSRSSPSSSSAERASSVAPASMSGSSVSSAAVAVSAGKTPRPAKNSLVASGTSDRARNADSTGFGIRLSVDSAVWRISVSPSSSRSMRMLSCSCARGASPPWAASSRTSRSTSPRLKKSNRGLMLIAPTDSP